MMDFSNYKFHASSMGLLMTDPKGKSNKEKYEDICAENCEVHNKLSQMEMDGKSHLKTYEKLQEKARLLDASQHHYQQIKDQIELSETAKSHLIECYVKDKYGRTKDVETDAMIKGTKMEEDGITVLSRNHKRMYKKNMERLENEWICGTPDILTLESIRYSQGINGETVINIVIDTKLSWDQFTFEKNRIADMDPRYYWQLQSYMWLDPNSAVRGKIAYCLVNTPEFLIEKAIKRMQYTVPESEWMDAEIQIRKNMTFDDMNYRERLIMHECARNDKDIERMKERVIAGRKFLQELDTVATWNVLSTELN